MAHGRVFVAGPPDDLNIIWLRERLQAAGYWPQTPALGREALYGSVANALPIVAGVDLWPDLSDDRLQALSAMDAQMVQGGPLLALCNTMQIDVIAQHVKRRIRLVGFSHLGPLTEESLIEVIPGASSSQEATRRAALFLGSLGFQTEQLPASSWAIYPRILSLMVNEAAYTLGEGTATAADIDLAMRMGGGFARGPLAAADAIGLDRILEILEALSREYGGERYQPAPLLRRLVRAGSIGVAAGQGFHSYAATSQLAP